MPDDMQKIKEAKPTGLDLLREPFPEHQVSKLPKETRAQIDERKARKQGCMVFNCAICGGHHHKNAVHLDYVGHAALTDRLLDCDPEWNWEPVDMPGLPSAAGGMWIKLTVCGVSRLGYGSADGKQGGDAIKEIIGDALRNAAMRFGAALDLWHKGDLHPEEPGENEAEQPTEKPQQQAPQSPPAPKQRQPNRMTKANARQLFEELQDAIREHAFPSELKAWAGKNGARIKTLPEDWEQQIYDIYADKMTALTQQEQEAVSG